MKNTRSFAANERANKLIPGGVNSPVRAFKAVGGQPFVVDYGKGAYLYDLDGNSYVDLINSWGPLVLGHARPEVVDAISSQAARGTSYGASHELEAELAEEIQKLMPSLELMRFVNSGTEAGMAVIRLARAATNRKKILKFTGCYHGHADSLLAHAGSGVLTLGLPDSAGVLESVTNDTIVVPYNNLKAVEEAVSEYGNDLAAIILEPVVGNAGLILPVPGFLPGLRKICDSSGALLIFDEVMTGFRVDLGGAQKKYGVTPDLTMLGKVIGGGLPVGAFGGRRDLMQLLAPLGPVYQAGTLSGNPLAMIAGLTTLKLWQQPGLFDAVAEATKLLVDEFRTGATRTGLNLTAESVGTMFGFFFQAGPVQSYEQAKHSNLEQFRKFFWLALEAGVYFAPSQFEAGFVSAAHLGEPIEHVCSVITKSLDQVN